MVQLTLPHCSARYSSGHSARHRGESSAEHGAGYNAVHSGGCGEGSGAQCEVQNTIRVQRGRVQPRVQCIVNCREQCTR